MKDIVVRKNRFALAAIFFVFALFSCNRKRELGAKEYTQWVENKENGLSVQKEIEEYEFNIIYKPIDYIIAYELKNGGLSENGILKRREELSGYQYYTFKIRSTVDNEIFKSGSQNENDYYQRLEYFTGDIQDDISLIDGKDTLPCAVYHFERSFGLSPYNTMVMSFEDKNSAKKIINDKTFIYDDKVLGTGKISIKIAAGDIENSPTLKLN